MAKDDNKPSRVSMPKRIQSLVTGIQGGMDRLYTNTYFNTPTNNRALDVLKTDIDDSINAIFSDNMDKVGIPNISSLYKRIYDAQKDSSVVNGVEGLFNDKTALDAISSIYHENSWVKDMRDEIDVICKYMPELEEALQVRKDNVLSADYFNKDFVFVKTKGGNSDHNDINFSKRISELKERYDVENKLEEWYEEAAKYGEQFVYVVPYEKAISKLLQTKTGTTSATLSMQEQAIIDESGYGFDCTPPSEVLNEYNDYMANGGGGTLQIELCVSNVLESAVKEMKVAKDRIDTINESSLNNIINEDARSGRFSKHLIDDDLQFEKFDDITSNDGLAVGKKDEANIKITTPGAVVKELDATNVIPSYIDSICMGYYYIECDQFNMNKNMYSADPGLQFKNSNRVHGFNMNNTDGSQDMLLKYISSNLSRYIDAKFVNANQDLRQEIYMILKHNDIMNNPENARLKITFIPPEDMIHIHFRRDKRNNHGISDLDGALFPAKLYISLLITNALAILTRGQDKRVYYVNQAVETNIAKTLINVMNQVKKGNMGIRQIENINNVLNITGRFNDYLIPVGPNGDPPIKFEVMPGQQVDIHTDLTNLLREMAVNRTDVPLELIQARQSIDYAVQLTMQNSKFLRKVFNRQGKYQKFCSAFVTKIYNAEYNESQMLEVNLPAPLFISMSNTNQIMSNNREYVQSIVDMEMADETDDVTRAIFTKLMTRHTLSTYLNMDVIETLKAKAKQERQLLTTQEQAVLKEEALTNFYKERKAEQSINGMM